jgi:ribose transport system permease protein
MPPFIVTLAMMQIASGQAKAWSNQQSIHDLPESFTWLGKGASLLGLPNTIALMAMLYIVAQVVLSSMRFGRHVYAVGGNAEAARLSGVNINLTVVIVYVISGLMAGIGGLIFASELRTGSSTYGMGLELYVIAAVVLGGTSLTGGEGNVIGTIIGALIIAVLHNGMDLTGASDPVQETVLGVVILAAVMLDRLRHKSWNLHGWFISPTKAQMSVPIPAETVLKEETV